MSGSTLVGGSRTDSQYFSAAEVEEHEVLVWDLEALQPLHTLRQPAGAEMYSLASDSGEVWGAVGREVVVWGRRG